MGCSGSRTTSDDDEPGEGTSAAPSKVPLPTPAKPPLNGSPHVPLQPPKPTILKRVKAIFDFDAMDDDELDFKEGDILLVVSKENEGWCLAQHEKSNKQG